MAKYRVIEERRGNGEIITHRETDDEFHAKSEAKRLVSETHNNCYVQRLDGERWQTGSVVYFWYFDRVAFYNRW